MVAGGTARPRGSGAGECLPVEAEGRERCISVWREARAPTPAAAEIVLAHANGWLSWLALTKGPNLPGPKASDAARAARSSHGHRGGPGPGKVPHVSAALHHSEVPTVVPTTLFCCPRLWSRVAVVKLQCHWV